MSDIEEGARGAPGGARPKAAGLLGVGEGPLVLRAMSSSHRAVGVWYEDFTQADDADVRRLLKLAQLEQEAHYQPVAGAG